jgi:Flavin containing amine oxidoreductase
MRRHLREAYSVAQVTVLESRDRLGGRVHTHTLTAPDGETAKVLTCVLDLCTLRNWDNLEKPAAWPESGLVFNQRFGSVTKQLATI